MKTLVDEHLAKASSLSEINTHRLEELRHQWSSAVTIGLAQPQGRESKLVAKFHALAKRMQEREADYLRFTVDERAPFDNNAAESQVRMVKVCRRYRGAHGPWPEPSGSARCVLMWRPRPSTVSACSMPWSSWSRASAGCPKLPEPSPRHLNSYNSGSFHRHRTIRRNHIPTILDSPM